MSSCHFSTVQSSLTKSPFLTVAPLPSVTVSITVLSAALASLGTTTSGWAPNFPLTSATAPSEEPPFSESEPHAAVISRTGTARSAAIRRFVL